MKHGKMILGELHADIPVIQGGMGVGISLSGLAGAVAVSYTHLPRKIRGFRSGSFFQFIRDCIAFRFIKTLSFSGIIIA